MKILYKCLLPWLVYGLCTMAFFVYALQGEREDSNRIWITILGLASLVGLVYQIFIEVRQGRNDTLLNYVTNLVNLMDVFQYLSTAWIVSTNLLGVF